MLNKAIVFMLILLTVLVGGCSKEPVSERAALIALYDSTKGDGWKVNTGWKDGILEPDGFGPIGSEGTWYGVTIVGDHVTGLSLSDNQLTGSIPPELGNLKNLTDLSIDGNELTGSIPPELGNLKNLTFLSLHSNKLTGSIPSELRKLKNFWKFEIGKLTGKTELGSTSSSSSSSSSAYSSSSSNSSKKGTLYVKTEHSGILSNIELDRYSVKIRKTHNLDGEASYGYVDEKTGSGKFWGEPASFYYKEYGYYEIECVAYDKYSKEVFHVKWSNVKHGCNSSHVTIYTNGMNPLVNCY